MTAPRLVVAGKLVVDEVLTCAAPLVPGSAQRATSRTITGGGQVWHTARAARVAGADVTVTGWCGADADSEDLRAALVADGVADRLAAIGTPSRAVVLVGPDGERTIVSTGGDVRLTALDVGGALVGAGWLHLDGYALDERSGDVLVGLAVAAHGRGVPVSVEPASVASLPSRATWLRRLPPLAALLGRPDELAACGPLLAGVPEVRVAHDGPRPVVTGTVDGDLSTAVTLPAGTAVTTTGAGDRFAGGWLAARLAGATLDDAARAGTEAAVRPPSG